MGSIDLGGSGMDTEGKIVLIGGTPAATITIGNGAGSAAVIKTGNIDGDGGYQFTSTAPVAVGDNVVIKGTAGSATAYLSEITVGEGTSGGNIITGGTTDFVISSATEVTPTP
jgi:hypothetical protein